MAGEAPGAAGPAADLPGEAVEGSAVEAGSGGLVAEAPVVEARAEAGSRRAIMDKEKDLNEFVSRLNNDAGENLVSMVLYGSAASQEFHADFSDINLLCVLRELDATRIKALAPAVKWWIGKGHPAPLLFSRDEIERAADVFSIEMLDIKQRHRMLLGEDLFTKLSVPLDRHRIQLEHELRTKLLFLRQNYLLAGDDRNRVLSLMLEAVSSFITLFRHTLIALGEEPPVHRPQIAENLARRLGFNERPFLALLRLRENKLKAQELDATQIFAEFCDGVDKVIQAVDIL